jgi:hypothetical protein
MPPTSRFLPGVRALLTIGRNLARCADALERLADHAEGRQRITAAPAEAPDDLDVSYADPAYLAEVERETDRLIPLLGRMPTPDEIDRAVGGVEWTPADAAAHQARVRAEIAADRGRRSGRE